MSYIISMVPQTGGELTYRFIPVDGPAVVTGVDITSKTLFITVELVRATEVHLSGEGCVVALIAEIMGISRGISRQVRGVIVGADLRWQLTADHDEARWSTQW
jgi:hypothetical protein